MDVEMNDVERLAVAQALHSVTGELVDTRDPHSLRSAVDDGFRNLYERTGSKSFDVKLRGSVVGTYSIRFSKPRDEQVTREFKARDFEALARWFSGLGGSEVAEFAAQNLEQFAEWHFEETGELPDGCVVDERVEPAVPKQYLGGTLKVDRESVADALAGELPQSVAGLLGGGNG